jgi:hypothetical protein
LPQVTEGDRLTHVNSVAVEGSVQRMMEALSAGRSSGYAELLLMRKRHTPQQQEGSPVPGPRGAFWGSDDDAFTRINLATDVWEEEEDIHGRPLAGFPLFRYEVAAGDTLPRVAEVFQTKVEEIRSANRERFKTGEPGA